MRVDMEGGMIFYKEWDRKEFMQKEGKRNINEVGNGDKGTKQEVQAM